MLEVKPQSASGPARLGPQAGLSIAEAARRTGVSVHTLRYYERAGLVVTPVDRTAGGRRRYHQLDLDWIVVCTRLRATGMPIKTIRRYAQLVSAGPGNEQDRLALLEAQRAEVTARLAEIQENLKLIDHKIHVYRGRLAAGDADQLWAPTSEQTPAEQPLPTPAGHLASVMTAPWTRNRAVKQSNDWSRSRSICLADEPCEIHLGRE
jgi:DNA-binding transcriptional MerR regulator